MQLERLPEMICVSDFWCTYQNRKPLLLLNWDLVNPYREMKLIPLSFLLREITPNFYLLTSNYIMFSSESRPSPPPTLRNADANTSDTIVISLISMLSEGPDVSLNGSPTVSPTTAAL